MILTHTKCRTLTQLSLQSCRRPYQPSTAKNEDKLQICFFLAQSPSRLFSAIAYSFKTHKENDLLRSLHPVQSAAYPPATVHSTSRSQPVSTHSDLLMKHPSPLPQSQGAAGDTSYCTNPAFQSKSCAGNTSRSDCFFYHSFGFNTSLVHLLGFVSTEGGGKGYIIFSFFAFFLNLVTNRRAYFS